MKKIFYLLYLLSLSNTIWGQTPTSGVTVIVHGFDAGGNSNLTDGFDTWKAHAIAIREFATKKTGQTATVFYNNPDTGFWQILEKDESGYRQSTTQSYNPSGELIFVYNWTSLSNDGMVSATSGLGSVEAAADNLFAMLVQPVVSYPKPLANKQPIVSSTPALLLKNKDTHFIGHSRGTVLLLQVLNRIRKYFPDVTIEHLTTLDPHPAVKMGDVESAEVGVISKSLPYIFGNASNCDYLKLCKTNNAITYKIPENVLKADNYFRQGAEYEPYLEYWKVAAFSGISIPTASHNRQLNNTMMSNNAERFGGAHSEVHNWYWGTFDNQFLNLGQYFDNDKGKRTSVPLVDVKNNDWYLNGNIGLNFTFEWFENFGTPNVKIKSGYYYSRLGGNYNLLPYLSGHSSVDNSNKRAIKIPYNGSFDNNNNVGWRLNGGQVSNIVISNTNIQMGPGDYISHSFMFFPETSDKLVIWAKKDIGNNPKFHIVFRDKYNTKIATQDSKKIVSSSNFGYFEIDIPIELKNGVGRVGILSENVVQIDEIYVKDATNNRLKVSASTLQNTIASTYFDFPVSYNVNPSPLIKGENPSSFNATIKNTLSTTWNGTLTMKWKKVTDAGSSIPLVSKVVSLAPNASVILDRGTQEIISETGEYILAIYANNDTEPIDLYHFFVEEPPTISATVINIETPTSVSMGSVNVGGSFDKIITIKNASTSNAVLTGTIAPVSGVDMSIVSGSQTLNLAPNQSQDITVRFSPKSGGVYNNSLTINGNFSGASKSITLTGTGVTVLPTLTYSRPAGQTYSLLDAPMGSFSDAIITVSNYSPAAFSGSFAVNGNGYSGILMGGSGSNLNIPAGGTQNITVRFTPTANGISTGSLSITGSATNTPATFNFSTLGTGFPTSGCVTSSTINIASNVNISTSGWREFGRFTLTNTSSSLPANISNFQAGPSDNFRISGYQQNAQFSLNPNESREFVVEISPISTQAYYSGVIGLNTPIQSCNSLRIQLRGTPAVSALNPPPLVTPAVNEILPYTGFDYTLNLGIRQGNIFGIARYKYFLIDMTSNQVILDNFDRGVFTSGNAETLRGFTVPIPGVTNPITLEQQYKVVTGHRYSWKVRAESVSDPNVYADSELRYFSAQQPSICYAPTDLSISNISKNSAVVTWNTVPTVYTNPATYNIELSSDNGNTYPIKVFNLTNPQTTITNLANAQNYKVRVITNCLTGNIAVTEYTRSQPSVNKSFTTLADCSTLTTTITPNSTQTICQESFVNLTASVGSSYQWYKDDVLITGATSQVYAAGLAGTYKVKVTYSNGCEVFSNPVPVTVIVKPQVLITSAASGICPNGSVNLSATQLTGTTYQWVKDGVNIPNTNSSFYSATSSGVYKLNYTQNGCTFTTDLLNLPLLPTPSIYISGIIDLTAGNTLSLSAFGANSYTWTGSNFASTANQITIPNVQIANAGNYNIVGLGTNGCSSNVNFTVTVSPPVCTIPTAILTGTQTINIGQSANLSVAFTGNAPYSFVVNGQTYSNISANPYAFSVTPTTTTTYNLSGVNNACGAGTVSGSAIVTVNTCPNQPDLIITAVDITKYAPNRVNYAVTVKNQGSVNASLGSVSLGVLGSPDALRNANDVFKSALFAGGGTLAPNQTYTINDFVGFNFADANYYLAFSIDYHALLAECNENNNDFVKLVNQCSGSGNNIVLGSLPNPFYAYNGTVIVPGIPPSSEPKLIVARAFTVNPAASLFNVSLVVGNCLTVPAVARVAVDEIPAVPSSLGSVQVQDGQLLVENLAKEVNDVSIWEAESGVLIQSKAFSPNTNSFVKGKKYIVRLESAQGLEGFVVEW